MRVISGAKKGAKLFTKDDLTIRPTGDKIKQSVFNMIQFEIEGRKVLDLFSGSGALGIESISRKAKKCTFVDIDIETTKKNIDKLSFNEFSKIVKANYIDFLNNTRDKFSLVILDPPYNKGYIDKSLELLLKNDLLENNSIIVAECDINDSIIIPSDFKIKKEVLYGRVKVYILIWEVLV